MKLIVLAATAAMITGCNCNKNGNHATTRPSAQAMQMMNSSDDMFAPAVAAEPAAPAAPTTMPAPAVATDNLSGAWQLAMPRQAQQQASIIATDDTHVTIKAGANLSGDYVVQGKYLLILTRDERMRTLAWKINSPDSLTVVRSPELGNDAADYTGVTLLRAADDATAATDQSQASTNESTSSQQQQ
jgi:hypothetical protein